MKQTVIYFVQAEDDGPIKIGFTGNIYNRLETLQAANWRPLKLLGLIHGDRKKEKEIHATFVSTRIRGEWFQESPELRIFLEGLDKELLGSVDFEWGDCTDCGSEATDRHKCADGLIRQYCRRCLMVVDGRLAEFKQLSSRKVRTPPQPCTHCGKRTKARRKGLCSSCSEYKRRNGIDRPLTEYHSNCSVCKKPVKRRTTKRCGTCHTYYAKFGKERSIYLISRTSS